MQIGQPQQQQHQQDAGGFPPTQWSLVSAARQSDVAACRAALAVLLQRYLPALRTHLLVRRGGSGGGARDVDDLLQGFVADKIIEQRLLEHAQQAKGKFRSFLLATLEHYAISVHRRENAAKRAPSDGVAELGEAAHELPAAAADPADKFNIAWARELIAEALRRMRAECEASARGDLWTIFNARVVLPAMEGREPADYAVLVRELGLAAPLDACRRLATAKRQFARHLREVAGEYGEGNDAAADLEIEELRAVLAGSAAQSGLSLRSSL
jgi:hypothetical protein